jgi:hypothetical protein
MRRVYSLMGAALLLGCADASTSTTAPRLSGAVVTGGVDADREGFGSDHGDQRLILTMLSSDEEPLITNVTPNITVSSPAHGQAHVRLAKDGQSMDFVLVVNDITNITQAHIHMGPKGANGGIVVWLFPEVTSTQALPGGGGPHSGLLASGTFTAANLRGALAGQPLSALVAAIAAGNAYVNVHTSDGVAPANTGPGDYPGGEVRGQLDRNGH